MLAERKLRKHVAVIHAYSQMSALQRKIINVLLFEAIYGDNQVTTNSAIATECRVPLTAVSKAVRFNSKNRQYLKEAIDGLASLEIEWNLLKDKVPIDISFLNLRVLHGAPTFFQDGTFNYSFHKVMLDLVKDASMYGTVDLEVQSQFESKYAHALFENGTRFVNLHKNKIIPLDTFRKMLGVHPTKYRSMRELTRNVIKPSMEEVNDRASFVINLQRIREGKKIEGFELSVQNKVKTSQESYSVTEKERVCEAIKQTFGDIGASTLKSILGNYDEPYIVEKIVYTKKQARVGQSGFYPVPYFISALKYDYKSNEKAAAGITRCSVSDKLVTWQHELNRLKFDLASAERRLASLGGTGDVSYTECLQENLADCQRKLQEHLHARPKPMTQVD